jgi:hypothetical protein
MGIAKRHADKFKYLFAYHIYDIIKKEMINNSERGWYCVL